MRSYRPFILEFLVFLLVAAVVVCFVAFGGYIQIRVKPHVLSYAVLAVLILSAVFPYRTIIRSGVGPVVDLLCRTRCETTATLTEAVVGFASPFSDRCTAETGRVGESKVRYRYTFCNKNGKMTLQSADLFEVVLQKQYRIVYGRYSKVLLSVSEA